MQVLSFKVRVNLGAMAIKEYPSIPQNSKTGTLPSIGFVWYPGHSLTGGYPSAGMHLVNSTITTDWATGNKSKHY